MRRLYPFVFFLLSIAILSTASQGHAESRAGFDRYDKLRAKYYSLRNTDLQGRRVSEWESVAKGYEAFVRDMPEATDAPKALLDAASLYEELYRRRGEDARVDSAFRILNQLASKFPKSNLADDALLKKAELLLEVKGDEEGARKLFQQIVVSYPDSDMVEVAKVKLGSLEGESDDGPDDSNEVAGGVEPTGPIIVIDPGHGGEDFGAVGVGELLEKDVVLAISQDLQKILKKEINANVHLTRTRDEFVPLATRMEMANNLGAVVFLSVHANASPSKKLFGTETYYLDNRGDKASHTLADRENASMKYEGEGAGGDLSFMLSDLIQSGKMPESIKLAETVQSELTKHLKGRWPSTKDLGVKRGPFYVLVGSHMPCALVETAFIDNAQDGKNLSLPEYRHDVARGLAKGLRKFLGN